MATIQSDVVGYLRSRNVDALVGTIVSPAGVTQAKVVDINRVPEFARDGLSAGPAWHTTAADGIGTASAPTSGAFSVVGDHHIRIDLDGLRVLEDGLAWAPAGFHNHDGEPVAACARGTLDRVTTALAESGFTAVVGHELEFLVLDADAEPVPSPAWAQYGVAGVLDHERFVRDLITAARAAEVDIEAVHPSYGAGQFEVSLAPLSPVAAADQLVAARLVVGRVARNHGRRVSMSPTPFAGGVGIAAHQNLSIKGRHGPLFSGGGSTAGLTELGTAALAGIVGGLADLQGVFAGSIVSGLRLSPELRASVFTCWGRENRSAAVRFIPKQDTHGHGARVEIRVIDPSANPYLATAALLGLAVDGISRGATLPPETAVDPQVLSDAQRHSAKIHRLSTDQSTVIDALEHAPLARSVLGDDVVDAVVAVRRYETRHYGEMDTDDLTERFRMAWSV
ncbi:glutamine synthetase family protein [Williamsia sp. CHRR-6]|uniref:glutamine synthetase family protein n=1 Tax=Williamsia sp. CHRR-6 TaxID=2835871 RepID=UPI001BDB5AD5|nr:glutamine synthetase family protein [Williamsia sp. CHRR-6]MBT0565855.1 glutamine synthetase [Williamsia sp. CHRR-6]